MNRKQRRQQENLAKRKPNRSQVKYLYDFQLEFESFDSIERLFMSVRHGDLAWDKDGWTMMGLSGEPLHVVSALEGWLQYWRMLADGQAIQYDDAALRKFCKSLEYEKPMNLDEVDAAYAVMCEQRRIYRSLPKAVTTSVAHRVRVDLAREHEIKTLMGVA